MSIPVDAASNDEAAYLAERIISRDGIIEILTQTILATRYAKTPDELLEALELWIYENTVEASIITSAHARAGQRIAPVSSSEPT